MRIALRSLLAFALLWQGVVVAAMPVQSLAASKDSATAAMPCHHAPDSAPMPCCEKAGDCAALCAPAALLDFTAPRLALIPAVFAATPARGDQHPPFRYTPIRPPIERFA